MKSKLCSFDDVRGPSASTLIPSAHRPAAGARRFFSGWLVLAFAVFGLSAASLRAKDKNLDIALVAQHIVCDTAGTERFLNEVAINPGEVVRYTATYRNISDHPLHKLAPTIPIPAGMELVPGSALPAPAFASLDGKTFEPYPIRRSHKLSDGREVVIELPVSAYRALRWAPVDLPPSAELMVAVRARVLSEAVALR